MPVTFQIDVDRALITTTVVGKVTPSDMRLYQQALHAHPDFAPHFATLTDFSDAEAFEGSADEIRQLVERIPTAPGTKRAYVAPMTLHFGLSRMTQVYVEAKGIVAQVFRDRASAERWLAEP